MGEVWGCFHISAPQPKAEDAAGLVLAVFAPMVTRIFRGKKASSGQRQMKMMPAHETMLKGLT